MAGEIGRIGWYEHHSEDAGASKEFYRSVFDWEMAPTDMDGHEDWTALSGGQPVFGLIQDFPGFEGFVGWIPYFNVADMVGSRDRAKAAGGTVFYEYIGEPGEGAWCAMFDPYGVPFALFQAGG